LIGHEYSFLLDQMASIASRLNDGQPYHIQLALTNGEEINMLVLDNLHKCPSCDNLISLEYRGWVTVNASFMKMHLNFFNTHFYNSFITICSWNTFKSPIPIIKLLEPSFGYNVTCISYDPQPNAICKLPRKTRTCLKCWLLEIKCQETRFKF
jgi:hypothetical protein